MRQTREDPLLKKHFCEARHGPHFTSLNLWCCLISTWEHGQDIRLVSYLSSLGLQGTERWLQRARPVKTRTVLAMKMWKFLISCRNDLSMLCLLNGMLNCPWLPAAGAAAARPSLAYQGSPMQSCHVAGRPSKAIYSPEDLPCGFTPCWTNHQVTV